jgi:hypothetical protein
MMQPAHNLASPARSRLGLTDGTRADLWLAIGLFAALVVIYNANGREVGSYDSQPTKFAARELLLRHTFTLDEVVSQAPDYGNRLGFIRAADGHYRSIYSPLPALVAAAVAWPFWQAGVLDLRAPRAPALIAKVTASLLVAAAVVLGFLSARQRVSQLSALLIAIGLGLGTGLWSSSSQTLWQTETAVFGLALAVLPLAAPRADLDRGEAWMIGIGLAIAGLARPQLAPAIAMLLAGAWLRTSRGQAVLITLVVVLSAAAWCAINIRWFGSPLGALPLVQSLNAQVHATGPSFRLSWEGFAGLLVSPSRGILVFSPVVAVAAVGAAIAVGEGWRSPLRWCVLAIGVQYVVYASFSIWWGGHTYGPRYLLDVLPIGVPLAALAMSRIRPGRVGRLAAIAALLWSVVVAGTGAFCYLHDEWNTNPVDVDRNHARLWSITDNQIRRCWTRGLSPQNFSLFDRTALQAPTAETRVIP